MKKGVAGEIQARVRTLPDWVAALIQQQTDPKGSSVSIMVSQQMIYISPLLHCCPQTHKASFSMLLLAQGVRDIHWGLLWVVEGCRNRRIQTQTRTAYCSVSTGQPQIQLFLPEWYIRSFYLQLDKCCCCCCGFTCIWVSAPPMRLFLSLSAATICARLTGR